VTVDTIGFWLVAVALVASSLAVVLTPNLFHSVLYLAAALVVTGLVFLLLGSPFLFGVQLVLYAGGVVVLLVFAIMLTERLVGLRLMQASRWIVNGAIVAAAFFVGVAGFLARSARPAGWPAVTDRTTDVARAVIGPFAAPFELLGVLLLAALLGALYFARPED
jgi:NADH:ubiquinone oxidoreductase subunit 6 (subunit J)